MFSGSICVLLLFSSSKSEGIAKLAHIKFTWVSDGLKMHFSGLWREGPSLLLCGCHQAVILYHPHHHWHMVLARKAVAPSQRCTVWSCLLQQWLSALELWSPSSVLPCTTSLSSRRFLQAVVLRRGSSATPGCEAEGTSGRCSWVLEVTVQAPELNWAQWSSCTSPAHVTSLPGVCLSSLFIAFELGRGKQWPWELPTILPLFGECDALGRNSHHISFGETTQMCPTGSIFHPDFFSPVVNIFLWIRCLFFFVYFCYLYCWFYCACLFPLHWAFSKLLTLSPFCLSLPYCKGWGKRSGLSGV